MLVDGAVKGKFPDHSGTVALLPELCIQRQPTPWPTHGRKPIRSELIQITIGKHLQIQENYNMKITFIRGRLRGEARGGITSVHVGRWGMLRWASMAMTRDGTEKM